MAMDCSFPRAHRLVQSQDFQHIFKNKQCRSTDRYLTVLAATNQFDYPRLGLAIAKKKIKKATDRQHIKRLVRESFRTHKAVIYGLDIIVLAQAAAAQADNKQILISLERHWERLAKQCKK